MSDQHFFREIPGASAYEDPKTNSEREQLEISRDIIKWDKITPTLEGPPGEEATINIAIAKDGKARRVNFWDLDKTLLRAEGPHGDGCEATYNKVEDTENLRKDYFAGFTAGNSYREWYRMYLIYGDPETSKGAINETYRGEAGYKKFEADYISNEQNRKIIDEPGHAEAWHELAEKIWNVFGNKAAIWMEEKYQNDPAYFSNPDFNIEPMMHLLKAKAKMGEAHAYMTANHPLFAKALVKYSGLWKYGLGLATDAEMVGGGKEIAIPYLIEKIESLGIKVPLKRLVAIGDSIKGDVGSAEKVMLGNSEIQFEGVWVADSNGKLEEVKGQLENEPETERIPSIARTVKTTAVIPDEVRRNQSGTPKLGKLGSRIKPQ